MSGDAGQTGETPLPPERHFIWYGLSAKLLLLTVIFVMISALLIFVPSIANFQTTVIEDRLRLATVAARALTTNGPGSLSEDMQRGLLDELDAYAIAVQGAGMKRLLAMSAMPPPVAREIDIDTMTMDMAVSEAIDTIIYGNNRTIRATGPYQGDGRIEVIFSENGLRAQMLKFGESIFVRAMIVSIITGALVYLSIRWLLVRPMQRIGMTLRRWAEDPADESRNITLSRRSDEIGLAEANLLDMQRQVQEILGQQRRLAELGLAVSKINHDLRNLLASAQLMSDRLAAIPDPTVQRFAPKLISALDRAINYAQAVLAYGKAQEAPPSRRLVLLGKLVGDVAETAGLPTHVDIEWVNAVPPDLEVDADADQLFRILLNLLRNAAQALEASSDPACVKRLMVGGERAGSVVRIIVRDTGPGVPEKAREHLFKPFQGSVRRGGTGLGLAIAAELVRAHGGTITLAETGPGAVFEIEIPDRPVQLSDVKRSRAS